MKKELVIEILKGANELENFRQQTCGVKYYPQELNFTKDDEDDYLYQLVCRDTILLNEWDRSFTISYLKFIGKTFDHIQEIMNNLYRSNNMDLDYLYFGDYVNFLKNILKYDDEWFFEKDEETGELVEKSTYKIKTEVCKLLGGLFRRKIDLTGYVQNRDIRYGEIKDQVDFEEDAFKEDGERMSEYTTAQSYEITENYVHSYDYTITLPNKFLNLMGINRNTGFRLNIRSGKDLQIFNRIALKAIKHYRLMRIPNIDTFIALCNKIIVEDGNLTTSVIDAFNQQLKLLIKFVIDPESYEYIMMEIPDTDLFDYSDVLLLYTKITKMLDLTVEDLINLTSPSVKGDIIELPKVIMLTFNNMLNSFKFKNYHILCNILSDAINPFNRGYIYDYMWAVATTPNIELIFDIAENLDIEEVPYYDDNLDYQDDEQENEECVPVMAE